MYDGTNITSILKDTRFLRNVIKYNYSTHDQCAEMLCGANINLINGSYAVSKVFGALNSRILNKTVSSIFNDGKVTKLFYLHPKDVGFMVLKKLK